MGYVSVSLAQRDWIEAQVIRFMAERQEVEFARLGLEFQTPVGPAAAIDRLPESLLRGS